MLASGYGIAVDVSTKLYLCLPVQKSSHSKFQHQGRRRCSCPAPPPPAHWRSYWQLMDTEGERGILL